MTVRTGRWTVWAAIGWTLLYVVSEVSFALEGRLGVTGGPRVDPEEYLGYGPDRSRWPSGATSRPA
ncbi:hypothetical protein [Planomonospora algeriensis]